MAKIAIYTSFAINYMAKARVLVRSVKECNPDIHVVAVVCDRFPPGFDLGREQFDEIWMVEDYPSESVKGWIFQHNIMELSTAVKGWALKRLLAAGYDHVMYLDPDCWILIDPARIVDLLPADYSVGVVPHTMAPALSDEEIRIVETSSLRHGIYNLGFLLVRNDANGRHLAEWWAARLGKYCIDDFNVGLFTDQRWFDLALGYFDFIKVIRHYGIDVASWNIGQRTLTRDGNGYRVNGDELFFYHFSGVGPTGVHRWVREKFAPADSLMAELEFRYESLINGCGQADLERIVPYFDCYGDGTRVALRHRTLYRTTPGFMARYPDPYEVRTRPSFRDEITLGGAPETAVAPAPDHREIETRARRLFDPAFYAGHYISAEGQGSGGPWEEYRKSGWDAEAAPNRFFDTRYYNVLVAKPEQQRYATPLHHYLAEGLRAGLSPCWIYDDPYYLAAYPDVREAIREGAFSCGFEHFVLHGAREGRDGCGYFNEWAYLARHPDVAAEVAAGRLRSGAAHYIAFGHSEKRPLR